MDYIFANTIANKENLISYSKLLSTTFPDTEKYSVEFLNWQYNQNPLGKVIGFDAFYNNELVAHYVAIPVLYTKNNQKFKGLLSLNTATHPNHTGKGLFINLASKTYQHAKELGYEFVIGVANQNSSHGFIKKLGFELISKLDVSICIGKPAIQNFDRDIFLSSVWDESSALWRLNNPISKYNRNNMCLTAKTHISFINALLSEREEFKTVSLTQKKSIFKLVIGLNTINPKRLLKIKIPDKLKQSPLNLIFKPLTELPFKFDSSNIYFELIDFDAY